MDTRVGSTVKLADLKDGDIIRSTWEVYRVYDVEKDEKWFSARTQCVYSPFPERIGRWSSLGGPRSAGTRYKLLPSDPLAWPALVEASKRRRIRRFEDRG